MRDCDGGLVEETVPTTKSIQNFELTPSASTSDFPATTEGVCVCVCVCVHVCMRAI